MIVAGLLTYANSFTHPFMFDDHGTVVENAQIRDLGDLGRVMSPPAETPVGGRPLVNLSFALNYAAGGLNPIGYRVVNLALHLACGLLIFGLVWRTLQYVGRTELQSAKPGGPQFGPPYVLIAFAVALLWLVHPLNSEVVDYVSSRSESMMAACYLLTLYAAARAHDATSRPPAVWMAAAIAACAAGMASKESMVTAPLMVVAYDRAFAYDSFRAAFRARGRFYAGLAATWIVLAVLMASHPRTLGNGFSTTIISPWTYMWNQMQMVTHYLRLAIWPDALTLNYGWPRAIGPADVWPYALFLVALLVVAVRLSWRRPRIAFLVTLFIVTLAPASSIVPVGAEVGAERRMYLPLAALITLGVVGIHSFLVPRSTFLVPFSFPFSFSFGRRNGERGAERGTRNAERNAERERNEERGTRNAERIAAAVMLLIAAALGARTFARNAEYASPLVMARTVLARWPTPAAEHLVGTELVTAGDPEEAILHLRKAAPGYPPAHYNLGVELVKRGQSEEGLAELQTFIREEPNLVTVRDARLAMSRAFEDLHQPDKAIEQLQLVLAASPGDAAAHGMLADVLAGAQQFEAAIREYRALVAARPDNAAGWTGLGVASIATGRPDDAIDAFRRAVAAAPQHAGYRENLARALLDRGDVDGAASHVREALRLAPADAAAHELSGRVLESRHDLDGARAEFTTALRLDPSYVPAQDGLRRVGR